MLAFLGILLLIWIVLTVVGFVVKGLFWLAIIGIIAFVVTGAVGWSKRKLNS